MWQKLAVITHLVLSLTITSSGTVIKNHTCEKEERIITESGTYDQDYLFLGNELKFSGVAQDLLFLGKRLTFNGRTELGLISLCEKLIFSGSSGNGIIAAGKDILIEGVVNSTSFFGCKTLRFSDSAVVNGTVFAGCAKLLLEGRLTGNLYAGSGEIIINNEINGDVIAYGGRVIIGEKGRINGNLTYSAKEKLSEKELAKISGTVTISKSFECDDKEDWATFKRFSRSIGLFIGFGLFISYLLTSLLLLFLPAFRRLDAKQTPMAFWRTALWGLIPVLIYPAIIVLSFVLVITIPLGFILIFATIPIFYLVNIIGTTLLGKYLTTLLRWRVEKRHYQFLIGAIAGAILCVIPGINFLSFIFISALGWGTCLSFLFNRDFSITK